MIKKTSKMPIHKNEKIVLDKTSIKLSIKDTKSKTNLIPLDAIKVFCNSQSIEIEPLLQEHKSPILIAVNHAYLQTQLDLTGVSNQAIFSFESDGKFIGASLLGKNGASSVKFLNLGRLILIAPLKLNLTAHSITHIKY
jgi:hypothetical protein